MKLEDKIDVSILNGVYGRLLTPHQSEMVRLYYDCDISLFEISEQLNISRQAVRDSLVRAEKSLTEYEKKLGLVAKNKELSAMLADLFLSVEDDELKRKIALIIEKAEE